MCIIVDTCHMRVFGLIVNVLCKGCGVVSMCTLNDITTITQGAMAVQT